MIEEFSIITTEVIKLIKSQQIEEAAQLVKKTRRSALITSFKERQQTVHELTLALIETRKQRDKLIQAVNEYSQGTQSLARAQVEQICRLLFDERVLEMQARKRQLSRPR